MDTISDPRSCVEGISSVTKKRMGIFRAVGLGFGNSHPEASHAGRDVRTRRKSLSVLRYH